MGVGIVGANPASGWAFAVHVPAIAATRGLRVSAVATTREESAHRAAELVGGAEWFTDPAALAESRSVDLVVIAVRVPRHRELIMATLPAGKPMVRTQMLTGYSIFGPLPRRRLGRSGNAPRLSEGSEPAS